MAAYNVGAKWDSIYSYQNVMHTQITMTNSDSQITDSYNIL